MAVKKTKEENSKVETVEYIKPVEPLYLDIEVRALGLDLYFPLSYFTEKQQLEAAQIEEKHPLPTSEDKEAEFTFSKVLPHYNFILKQIMSDCLAFYSNDSTTKEGQFIQKFAREKYDPFDLDKSLEYFKNICFLSIDEFTQIGNHYSRYLKDLASEMKSKESEYQNKLKSLDIEPNISAEEKKLRIIELENELQNNLEIVKKKLKVKYGLK